MRIIAGSARGRTIETQKGTGTRPTADRVKESVFSILQARLQGARVLDLFAGSGAMGLEALSRGAAHAVLADHDPACVRLIRKNADRLGFTGRCTVVCGECGTVLRGMQGGPRFDLVFLDPPYASGLLAEALHGLFGWELLAKGAVVACEHGAGTIIEDDARMRYAVCDRRRYGRTGYTFVMARGEEKV